jgi:hypothetical protein
MYAYNVEAAAQVIAAFHASWANIDPLWGDLPFARPVTPGSGAFAKGAESWYVTRTVAHARDTRIRSCHRMETKLQHKEASATAAGVFSPARGTV